MPRRNQLNSLWCALLAAADLPILISLSMAVTSHDNIASRVPEGQSAASSSGATPLMRQYAEMKARNPGAVSLFRMGDFYEMFNDDAKIASQVLGLTLTSRNSGAAESTPLAGFP